MDKLNVSIVWEEESIEEINKKLQDRSYYLTVDGKLAFSASDDISEITMSIFTE